MALSLITGGQYIRLQRAKLLSQVRNLKQLHNYDFFSVLVLCTQVNMMFVMLL